MAKRWPLYTILLLIILFSCRRGMHPTIPENVRQTMRKSGKNSIEFVKAIVEYRNPKDSLKLQAIYYLIANMEGHGLRTYLLQDTTGDYVDYNIMDYASYQDLMVAKDSMEQQRGPLHFVRHYFGPDIYFARGKDLSALVDRSFEKWRQAPWARNYSFDMFCSKMLPYKINDALYDSLMILNGPQKIDSDTIQSDNTFDVAGQIIAAVDSLMHFDKRFLENPTDRTIEGWETFPGGRAEDKAALITLVLRSAGIACAVDYVPNPRESGKEVEYWVVIWNGKGEKRFFFPFSDSLAIPQEPVKIFRRTYHTYNTPLPEDSVYRLLEYHHLKTGKYKDVTSEYYPVTNWKIAPEQMGNYNMLEPLFLAVRKHQRWLKVDWRYFTKKQVFRELKHDERYALIDADGKTLLRKYFRVDTSRREQSFRDGFSVVKSSFGNSILYRYESP